MGQYYVIVNKTKKEYLNPHVFGDGLKAWEIVANHRTVQALGILLIKSDGGGGGDLQEQDQENPQLVGRWVDDQLVIIGDYDSSNLYQEVHGDRIGGYDHDGIPIWEHYDSGYIDISYHVLEMMYKEHIIEKAFLEKEMEFHERYHPEETTPLKRILTGESLTPLPPKESRTNQNQSPKPPEEESRGEWYVEPDPEMSS